MESRCDSHNVRINQGKDYFESQIYLSKINRNTQNTEEVFPILEYRKQERRTIIKNVAICEDI